MQSRALRIKLQNDPSSETEDVLQILLAKEPRLFSGPRKPKSEFEKSKNCWTFEEDRRFIEGLRTYGKNWVKVGELIGDTKTYKQMLKYAENMRIKDCLFFIKKH